jgi:hypothetical protein
MEEISCHAYSKKASALNRKLFRWKNQIKKKSTNHFYLDIQNRFFLFSEMNKPLTTDYKQVQHCELVHWFPITDCRLPLLDGLSLKYHAGASGKC